jgi:SHS2 domain-containing protein
MKKYEFLEHTADAKYRAFGKTMGAAFANAALAMASLMYDPGLIAASHIEEIKAEGNDREQLLYNFLEEFLVLMDSRQFVLHGFPKEIKIIKTGNKFSLKAEAIGDYLDKTDEKYDVRPVVKAVTYNDMKISEKPLYVQVVVDI